MIALDDFAVNYLRRYGYLPKQGTVHHDLIKAAVERYQAFVGLEADGIVGKITTAAMAAPRCGLPDHGLDHGHECDGQAIQGTQAVLLPDGKCAWNRSKVSYFVMPRMEQELRLGLTEMREIIRWAFGQFSELIQLDFVEVDDYDNADIYFTPAHLDGPGRVIGDAHLPCGMETRSKLRCRLDSSETWDYEPNKGRIPFRHVVWHEIGHLIGMRHVNAREPALMNPMLNTSITELTEADKRELRSLRYPARHPRSDEPSNSRKVTIDLDGVVNVRGHRLIKV